MSENSRPPAPSVLRTPRFWLAPVIVVTLLMSALAALYMGGILDPKKNLDHFPIALVNQDEGDTVPGSTPPERKNFGNDIAAAIDNGVDHQKIDLQQIGIAEAQSKLDSGTLYGAIVIPSDFSKRTTILAQASVVPGEVEQPIITIYTNPRAGTVSASLVQSIGTTALEAVNKNMGEQLTALVTQQLEAGGAGTQMSGASRLLLENPVNVLVVAHNPLPDGTGFGLAAFYFALLLVLAGFTGATVVNTLVDGMLGYAPTEVGPLYVQNDVAGLTRFHTLLVKWAFMIVLAGIVSALFQWISRALGLPVTHGLALWEYSTLVIAAVGITAMSVMAAFGSVGMLVNLFIFVILALPSSGGTIPLEASPRLYAWLAQFEPMHQIYMGCRAILFFDARSDSGLLHAVVMTLAGLLIGLILGFVVTRFYDRKGFDRTHRPKGA
ncbi:YhgE/Pip-like protein [Rhodococcus sp. 27YEA15]|uniref:YhgE/Pip domain-containing protein n=1 Tax=Rhodococcus sp. 27YEA15 TaxID=3156259 RepID=UPI003C7992C9